MRTCLSISLLLMVVSEMVGSTNGLGHFIIQSQRTLDITSMWSGMLLLSLLGYARSWSGSAASCAGTRTSGRGPVMCDRGRISSAACSKGTPLC